MNVAAQRSIMVMATALLLAGGLLLTGCSQSPLEPNLEPISESSQPQVLSRSAAFTSGAQGSPVAMYSKAVISAKNGGQLALFDVLLDVPPGALDVDTTYSISIPDINVFYNEFGTDGLVFNVPVTVTMSYRDANLSSVNESSIRIAWWNEDANTWINTECELDQINQVVTGKLHHFSAYALVSD